MFNRILVANDGSQGACKALQVAIDLARQYEAELHHITVEEGLPRHIQVNGGALEFGRVLYTAQEAVNYSRQVSQEGCKAAMAEGVKMISYVVRGDAIEEITRFVNEQGFDLIVIGYAGHSAMFGHNWGSSSEKLTELSSCSVLVVK